MFSLFFKIYSPRNTTTLEVPTNIYNFCYLQLPKSFKFCSISQNQLSPTVSYLTNKCGVPLDSAILISQNIQIGSTEKPDSVLQLLKNYDFTQTQIIDLIMKFPSVMLADPVKTLQPKFEFFQSAGLSKTEIAKIVSSYKRILSRSLTKQIMPTYSFLKRFLKTDKDIVTALMQIQCGFVVSKDFHLAAESNIEILRNHGVPDFNIGKLLMTLPRAVTLKKDRFKELVGSVEGMRLDPHSQLFIRAISIIAAIGKSGWKNKVKAYNGFGWSEEDVISAFKLQPLCMAFSEKKIGKMMDFYLNELGLTTYDVNKFPYLISYSLENRVIPRCSVLQILVSNGIVKKSVKLTSVLNVSKLVFEKRYVDKYKEATPEILKAYKGELGYPKLEVLHTIL